MRRRFGRRRMTPHAGIATAEPHARAFLCETLAELGFVVHACADAHDVATENAAVPFDLVVLPLAGEARPAAEVLRVLASAHSEAAVLLIGGRHALPLAAAFSLGEELKLSMLPPLTAPFRVDELAARVAHICPPRAPLQAPVDLDEALASGWLELWYQAKVDLKSMLPQGAEALCRLRHPHWGIVEPASFLPNGADPPMRALSEFVVERAMADWLTFARQDTPLALAVNVPLAILREPDFVRFLWSRVPAHPQFGGLLIEVNASEMVRDLDGARAVARQLRFANIGLSIDDLGPEWREFAALPDFPFVEIKVDAAVASGCAVDPEKRAVCSGIVELAARHGVPTVAEGIESAEDFYATRELGFDLLQGFVCARPMEPRKFVKTLPRLPIEVTPNGPR
ncbi:response regulator receiverprotein [Rhodovulum sp. PH10]|nr:response regulator receiverprotein [Rhodovulum sp. PH10]